MRPESKYDLDDERAHVLAALDQLVAAIAEYVEQRHAQRCAAREAAARATPGCRAGRVPFVGLAVGIANTNSQIARGSARSRIVAFDEISDGIRRAILKPEVHPAG
jgi:hypothetical protein